MRALGVGFCRVLWPFTGIPCRPFCKRHSARSSDIRAHAAFSRPALNTRILLFIFMAGGAEAFSRCADCCAVIHLRLAASIQFQFRMASSDLREQRSRCARRKRRAIYHNVCKHAGNRCATAEQRRAFEAFVQDFSSRFGITPDRKSSWQKFAILINREAAAADQTRAPCSCFPSLFFVFFSACSIGSLRKLRSPALRRPQRNP